MRNRVSFYKHYRRHQAVSSGWCRFAALGTVVLLGAAALSASQTPATPVEPARQAAALPGTPSPALAKLFTPRYAPAGAYEVRVFEGRIERARQAVLDAARRPTDDGGAATPPVIEMDPLQAFGEAGSYQRTTVARLYGALKAKVVRIPVERDGRTVAAVTLVSPYPDPTLSRLEPGTMAIVLHLSN